MFSNSPLEYLAGYYCMLLQDCISIIYTITNFYLFVTVFCIKYILL